MGRYWEKTGKYEDEYQKLRQKLIPVWGSTSDPDGEILRIVSNIYYGFFNNGDNSPNCENSVSKDEWFHFSKNAEKYGINQWHLPTFIHDRSQYCMCSKSECVCDPANAFDTFDKDQVEHWVNSIISTIIKNRPELLIKTRTKKKPKVMRRKQPRRGNGYSMYDLWYQTNQVSLKSCKRRKR